MSSQSTELTERCPQVIEPGPPPRTNPNHPTVSSLVSRVPLSLVSHGCLLTTPLSQCTLVSAPPLHLTLMDSPPSIWPQTPMSCSSHRWLDLQARGKKRERPSSQFGSSRVVQQTPRFRCSLVRVTCSSSPVSPDEALHVFSRVSQPLSGLRLDCETRAL